MELTDIDLINHRVAGSSAASGALAPQACRASSYLNKRYYCGYQATSPPSLKNFAVIPGSDCIASFTIGIAPCSGVFAPWN